MYFSAANNIQSNYIYQLYMRVSWPVSSVAEIFVFTIYKISL